MTDTERQSEPIDDRAFLTLAFSFESSPNAYALLVGAGVSIPSQMPSAWDVLNDLCRRMADKLGESDQIVGEPADWFKEKFGEDAEYGPLLEQIAPDPTHRQELLASYFEATKEDIELGRKQPTDAHHAIAKLVEAGIVRVIVTLNFDRLIEKALTEAGIDPLVITTLDQIRDMPALHTIPCCVIHLHGDYRDAMSMRNTEAELEVYEPELTRRLERILEDYGLIAAGWSAKYDPALREAIKTNYWGRHALVWIEPGPQKPEAQQLREAVSGILWPTTANDAFIRLAQDLAPALVRRRPVTLEVDVESVKSDLATGARPVRTQQRLNSVLGALASLPEFNLPQYNDADPYGDAVELRQRIVDAAKTPAALIATTAFWGTAETDFWWLSELSRLSTQPNQGGLDALRKLNRVAAIQLYYGAGIAAFAANRHDLLARLLGLTADSPFGGRPERLAVVLDPELVLGQAARTFYDDLAPLLLQCLTTTEGALEDAWQKFETTRLASTLMLDSRFTELAANLDVQRKRLVAAESHTVASPNDAAAQTGVNQAWQEAGRALGRLADLVPASRIHVLAQRYARDSAVGAPAALHLADELREQGLEHALIRSGVLNGDLSNGAANACEAVSVSLGRYGNDLTVRRLPPGGGTIPTEIWIDSALTPYERRSIELDQTDSSPTLGSNVPGGRDSTDSPDG